MKYFIIFIVVQIIAQPIFCQLLPLGTKCGCIEVPVERKCGCFDVPILPKQELISPMNSIGFGSQGRNLLLRDGMLGNQYANIMPWNKELNLIENMPINNMYMPNKMVTTRSLSPLKSPVSMQQQQYNRLPDYIDDFRRNQNVMSIKSQLAQLAGLAMTSANLLSSLPTYSNNLITKNALNSLPMQDLGLGNFKPISYQNNIVPRLF